MKRLLKVAFVLWTLTAICIANAAEWDRLLEQADSISSIGYYRSAADVGYQALELAEIEFGPQDTVIASILEKVGTYLNKNSSYEDAEQLFSRALAIREATFGPDHPTVATSLLGLANSLGGLGRYAMAQSKYERSLKIRENAYGMNDVSVAEVEFKLGELYQTQIMSTKAEVQHKKALEVYESVYGFEHVKVAEVLTALGAVATGQFSLARADSLFQKAQSILLRHLGPDHPGLSRLYRSEAYCSAIQGKYVEADSLCRKAICIDTTFLGPEHSSVGRGYFVLASIYLFQSKYSEAKAYITKSIEIFESSLGPEHPLTGRVLSVTAQVYRIVGLHAEADSLARRSIEIRAQSFDRESLDMAEGLNSLASACIANGKFNEADSLYLEAIGIMDRICEPDFPDLAAAFANYAASLVNQCRYSEAEPLIGRALQAYRESTGLARVRLSSMLTVIAALHVAQGRYKDAEVLYREILDDTQAAFGEDHSQVAMALQNLAIVNVWLTHYPEADSMARRSLAILERTVGPKHEDVAGILTILGTIATLQGRYQEAESSLNKALTILQETLGPSHPRVAGGLDNLADVYAHEGKLDRAAEFHDSAYAIRINSVGHDHLDVAEGLESYSDLLMLEGERLEALRKLQEAFDIRRGNFDANGRSLSESDALTFSKQVRNSADKFLSCYFDSEIDEPEWRDVACDVVLSSKGQVSDMIFDRRRPLFEESDIEINATADTLRSVQFQISTLFAKTPVNEPVDGYKRNLDSLTSIADRVESKLARISASFREQQRQKDVSVDLVRSQLPENSVLLEYFRFEHYIPLVNEVETAYGVAILSRESPPQVLKLGEASDIDRLIDGYRRHMLQVSTLHDGPGILDLEDYRRICEPLYRSIFEPAEEMTRGKDLVLIAPDGGLSMISFAGLPMEDGRYLLEEYAVHYLSSGRDLLRTPDIDESASGLFALGDPDYDALDTVMTLASDGGGALNRNIRSNCGELDNIEAVPLPGTRKELEQLISTWANIADEPVAVFYGKDASEEIFKTTAPGYRVLHLATHGYYLGAICNPDIPGRRAPVLPEFAGENPLLLSGLLLTGSNRAGKISSEQRREDGILTAYEVCSMDLSGTQLVVLSACETGLGKVERGEGIYGLRRAFQMAGASTVVSALWPIPDDATAHMMSRLYAGKRESVAESLRSTQIERIEELRGRNEADHPYSWGAFIAVGDWRW